MTRVVSNTFSLTVRDPSVWPTWRNALTQWQWARLSSATITSAAPSFNPGGNQADVINGYNGLAADYGSGLIYAHGGGHGNYAGNEVYRLDLHTATPQWSRLNEPSASVQVNVAFYADGKPSAAHTYRSSQFVSGKFVRFGNGSQWGDGQHQDWEVVVFNPSTGEWAAENTYDDILAGGRTAEGSASACGQNYDNGDVYTLARANDGTTTSLVRYDGTTLARTLLTATTTLYPFRRAAVAVDTTRGRVVFFGKDGAATGIYWDIAGASLSSEFSLTDWPSENPANLSIEYVDSADMFYVKTSTLGNFYQLNPVTWATDVVSTSGATGSGDVPVSPPAAEGACFFRCRYLPTLGGFAYYPRAVDTDYGVYFLASE